jgi:hypothetical protein
MRSRRSVQRKHTALFRRENGSTAVRRSLPANATSGASMMRRFSATSERTATAGRTTIRRTCGIEPQSAACVRARSGRSLAGPFHITASLQPPGRSHGGRLKAQQEVADSMPSSSGCRPVLDAVQFWTSDHSAKKEKGAAEAAPRRWNVYARRTLHRRFLAVKPQARSFKCDGCCAPKPPA